MATSTPTKWWQWFLMYPALLIALGSSIPSLYQLYQSYRINVPYEQVPVASYRQEISAKTAPDCLTNLPLHPIPSSDNSSIFVGVCPHRALAIMIQPDDSKAQPIFRLISWPDIVNKPQASLLVKEAAAKESSTSFNVAQKVAQGGLNIICQKRMDKGLLLIRISYPDGKCFDQTVNTYTSAVIRTVPASCDQRCQ